MKRTTISFEPQFSKLDEHHVKLAQSQREFNEYVKSFYNEVIQTMNDRYSTCTIRNKNYLDKTKAFLEKEYSHIIKLK